MSGRRYTGSGCTEVRSLRYGALETVFELSQPSKPYVENLRIVVFVTFRICCVIRQARRYSCRGDSIRSQAVGSMLQNRDLSYQLLER